MVLSTVNVHFIRFLLLGWIFSTPLNNTMSWVYKCREGRRERKKVKGNKPKEDTKGIQGNLENKTDAHEYRAKPKPKFFKSTIKLSSR